MYKSYTAEKAEGLQNDKEWRKEDVSQKEKFSLICFDRHFSLNKFFS